MGIKSIAHSFLNYYKPGGITNTELNDVILAILLSGHFKIIMKIDDSGRFISREHVDTYPGTEFLSKVFEDYRGYIPDLEYHQHIWNNLYSTFLKKRFEDLSPFQSLLGNVETLKKILKLHERIQIELGKKIDIYINLKPKNFESAFSYFEDPHTKYSLKDIYLKENFFDVLLDYYQNFEIKYKEHAEYIELKYPEPTLTEIEKIFNKYHEEWEKASDVQRFQRLLWGILTDFRHPVTGKRVTRINSKGQNVIDFREWFKFPLHHWKTAIRYENQETGEENKYDCEFFAVIIIPDSDKYGGFSHTTIGNQIRNQNRGLYWENYLRETIIKILNGEAPDGWSDTDKENFETYTGQNRDTFDLILNFLTHLG
ncbi:MAG: hypothetical protein ACTSQJ_07850, partial [Promethearchaeota archaeon]